MTLAVSTSSPVASVAVFEGGALHGAWQETGAAVAVLPGLVAKARQVAGPPARIAVDVGPGGFTAVRSGVAFCKAYAWALGVPLGALSAFDLVEGGSVAFPARKGLWHLRSPGCAGLADAVPPGTVGYRLPEGPDTYPDAALAGRALGVVVWERPELIVPAYGMEPTITPRGAGGQTA
jgi:hypothetical protein